MFLISLGLTIFAVAVLGMALKSFGRDIRVSFGGQTKTNVLSDGSGSKAQALTDKPRAFNPLGAIAGAVGIGAGAAGVAAGVAGKVLPGAAGLAFKGAKLGVNAAKMAGGGLAAGAEALNKATGLTRKISGFVKPIGQKVRFKANSVTGFLKDQLETEGDRLRNRFRENKQIISNNLPSGFKRGIKGINNGIKAGAKFTRDKAKASLEEMKANRAEWNEQKREMARKLKRKKALVESALQNTSGYKVYREGLDGIKQIFGPAKLPKKSVFHAQYGANNSIPQEREDSNKFMNYTQTRDLLTNSKYLKAALTPKEIEDLRQKMEADYQKHGDNMRFSLSPEYKERIRDTKEKLNSSYGQRFAEAFEKSNNETEEHALKIMQAELGKNQGFRTVLEGHIKNELGDNASRQEIQETRQKILGDITKSIINNGESVGDISASDFLSENDMRKLSEKIGDFQYYNKSSNIIDTQKELIKEYASAHPEATHEDAKAIIKEQTSGIAESLTRLQQSTPRTEVQRTEVVTNTTQTQVVQAAQTAGNTANNTVVNNTTGAPATASSSVPASTSTDVSKTSDNNAKISSSENTKTVNTTIVQTTSRSAPSIDVDKLTKDISEGLRAGITKDVTNNVNAVISGFMENFKDGTLKDLENTIKENGSMREMYKLIGGGNEVEGRNRYKELMKRNGTVDELYGMIKKEKEKEYEPITEYKPNKRGRKNQNKNTNKDTFDDAANY